DHDQSNHAPIVHRAIGHCNAACRSFSACAQIRQSIGERGMTDIERPWLASYPPGVPARINLDEYRSIAHVLEIACERFSHRPAFENMGKVLTYADVDRLSRQFAAYLLNDLKLRRGDRVAIMLPNVLQYPIAIFGVLRAGL